MISQDLYENFLNYCYLQTFALGKDFPDGDITLIKKVVEWQGNYEAKTAVDYFVEQTIADKAKLVMYSNWYLWFVCENGLDGDDTAGTLYREFYSRFHQEWEESTVDTELCREYSDAYGKYID